MLDMLKSMLDEIKKNSLIPMLSNKSISIVGIIVVAVYLVSPEQPRIRTSACC